jgi:hypothetical protein
MTQWYYQDAGDVRGPLSLEELKRKAADGDLGSGSLVRDGADGPWVAASEVPQLAPLPADSAGVAPPVQQIDSAIPMELGPEGVPDSADEQKQSVRRSPLALHPCQDCGHMVSRQASACPQCGRLFYESAMTIRYPGEHPVPVLIFFSVLAVAFILLSPPAVYFVASSLASKFIESAEVGGVATIVTIAFACSMIASAVLGGAVGKPRMAYITGLFLGLFFGPLGVFAAFAIDKRPQCCHCSSRLDGLARECPQCHARLTWKVEPSWY